MTHLIQLYIIGVFASFTLGQIGMVVHWTRRRRRGALRGTTVGLIINGAGAALTAGVLVIVTITKFTHGAWIVFVLMPVLWYVMYRTRRYYRQVGREIAADDVTEFGSSGDHAIVLVGALTKPSLKSLDYAIAMRHETLEAVHVAIDREAAVRLERQWAQHGILVPLTILDSPYRGISEPLIAYIAEHRRAHGPNVTTVYLSQFVVGHWWQGILHNHAFLDDAKLLYRRPVRPLPGQDRRGEPARPLIRRHLLIEPARSRPEDGRATRDARRP